MPIIQTPPRLKAGYDFAANEPLYSFLSLKEMDLYYLGIAHYVRDLLLERQVKPA